MELLGGKLGGLLVRLHVPGGPVRVFRSGEGGHEHLAGVQTILGEGRSFRRGDGVDAVEYGGPIGEPEWRRCMWYWAIRWK